MKRALITFAPRPDAQARVFCMPHAGGFANAYRAMGKNADPRLELWSAMLPGRGSRAAEVPVTRMQTLVDELTWAVSERADKPYALFGHSMGALVAFELARRLDRPGLRGPRCLFVSSAPPPDSPRTSTRWRDPGDAETIQRFRELGGIPPAVADNREAMAAALPALQADLELVRTYQAPSVSPLACSITVLGGLVDPLVSRPALAGWSRWTRASFAMRMFPGGHFYLQQHPDALLKLVENELGLSERAAS